ncbi:vitamin K epoxide reductase family protein [Nitrospira moscoviensis]|nr:vitamin K epoxide reductase family protein [Nitrospira moscoviensis]
MPPDRSGASSIWVMPWNAEGLSNDSVRRSVELASMAFGHATEGRDPQRLRADLRDDRSPHMRRRRAITVLSLVGMASMAIVSLFQMGVIRHLPDPPSRRFHSDKVNASSTAYHYGVPDGPLSLAAHALNAVLAGLGGAGRARRAPWIPLLAAGKAAAGAGVAAKYLFHQMPVVEQAWCGYCIVDALAHLGACALALPEAIEAAREHRWSEPTGGRS